MGCFAIYPREVYLIFPFDEQGKIAGVYVDFFLNNYEIRVFNSHKKGCVIRDWKRLENPKGRISHYSLCELKEKQKHDQ